MLCHTLSQHQLLKLRTEKQLSQAELVYALLFCFPPGRLQMETGMLNQSIDKLILLAKVFDVCINTAYPGNKRLVINHGNLIILLKLLTHQFEQP